MTIRKWPDDFVNKVICGDCLEVMKQMPSGCMDMVITSPPYNCRKNYKYFDDQMPWNKYYSWMDSVLGECYRVLQVGGTIAIIIPPVVRFQREHKYANTWSDFDETYKTHRGPEKIMGKGRIEPIGLKLFFMMSQKDNHMREPIIWVKGKNGNAICSEYRMGCDSDPYMRPAHEYILLGSKGRWFHRGGTGRRGASSVPFLDETKDVWFIPPRSDRKHPAVFPKELPARLILLFTHAHDPIILDPFCGIGSTIFASKQLKRNFIGIEIDPEYCKITEEKLAQRSPIKK